jgi:hypothetical protein
VLVGGYIVASKALGDSGTLDLVANTPASILNRTQQVEYLLNYSPPGGNCRSGALPIELTINPSSGFSARSGEALAPGFERSPQDLASSLGVDLVNVTNENLTDACRLLVSLAQILPDAPPIHLVSTSQVPEDSGSTDLVVGATSGVGQALRAPLQFAPFRILASDNLHIAYTVNQPFAALEEYSLDNHDVLMSGAYQNPKLGGTLTNAVLNDSNGWYGLGTAQVAVVTSDGVLRIIKGQSIATQALAPNPSGSLGIPAWLVVGLAIVFALIVVRVIWLSVRMRRLRKQSAAVRNTSKNDPDESSVASATEQSGGEDSS